MKEWGYEIPVALGAPVGHVDDNLPVIVGSDATLTVNEDETTLEMRF